MIYLIINLAGVISLVVCQALFHFMHITTTEIVPWINSPVGVTLTLAIPNGASFGGGFVAAWIAKTHRIKNAFSVWVLDTVMSAPVRFVVVGISLGVKLFMIALLGCSACFGGWFAKWIMASKVADLPL